MPKITDNEAYPPVTEVKESDKLLGVQEGEVRQFPANLVGGGGEQWEVIYENSNGAIIGEYTKTLDPDAGEIIRVTRVSQGVLSDGWSPSVTSLEMLTLTPNLQYETFIIRKDGSAPEFNYIGYIQYSDMDFSFVGNPMINKLIYKIERLVK